MSLLIPPSLFGGDKPNERTFWEAADKAYDKNAPDRIGNMYRQLDTPTMDIQYSPGENSFLVAVRGTAERKDIFTDAALAVNTLRFTGRQRNDVRVLEQVMKQYPPNEQEQYLTGHSLGGAIVRQLKRDFPNLKDAVLYNPAFQPWDLFQQQSGEIANRQVKNDPLYNTGGWKFSNKIVVPPILPAPTNWFKRLISKPKRAIEGHQMDNFKQLQGGQKLLRGGDKFSQAETEMFKRQKAGEISGKQLAHFAYKLDSARKLGRLSKSLGTVSDVLNWLGLKPLSMGVSAVGKVSKTLAEGVTKTPQEQAKALQEQMKDPMSLIGSGENKKYVPTSLSASDKAKQRKSIKEGTRRPKVDYPERESKWTKKAQGFFGEGRTKEDLAQKIAEQEGKTKRRAVTLKRGIEDIFRRGEAAYRSSGSRPNTSPEQWAYARVYSVLFGGPSRNQDADIVKKQKLPLLK